MLQILALFAVVAATNFTHASPVENEKRQDCETFLRELFKTGNKSEISSLAERLNLRAPFALEIFKDDLRRCPSCFPMGHSEGILHRIPPNQFAQVYLHDLPEFRTQEADELRAAFQTALKALGAGGQLILTLETPTDWPVFNAQLALGRELGLEVNTLMLADFDMVGAIFVKQQ